MWEICQILSGPLPWGIVMEKYFKKRTREELIAEDQRTRSFSGNQFASGFDNDKVESNELPCVEISLDDLPADPGLRKNIYAYDANDRERVQRAYLQRGPCQDQNHVFPGLRELDVHVGDHNSIHTKCLKACEDLMNASQHIEVCLSNQSDQAQVDYRTCLTASIDCIRFLLCQGLTFCGLDEFEKSTNEGNFLELLHFLSDHNEDIKRVVLKNAPENLKMIAPKIQKDIVNAAAVETTKAILKDVGDEQFSILVDEACDISVKEQMAVVLHYVNRKGCIIERFLGIVHVGDTTALSLKASIESLFAKHGLSMSSLRGQGYDGASNMQGEFNGLKNLIMLDNKSAFYIHCFAHQLQLTLVAVAKKRNKIGLFFNLVTNLSNIMGASCKRRDILREKQFQNVVEEICNDEIMTGRGLNQEATLKRAGDTRWSSHYTTLLSVILLFSSVIDVLEVVEKEGTLSEQRAEATSLLDAIERDIFKTVDNEAILQRFQNMKKRRGLL